MTYINRKPAVFYESFSKAAQNMEFDEEMLLKIEESCPSSSDEKGRCFFRFYQWQYPSITYSCKRKLPEDLVLIDHSSRLTGGGIVFHSPGDLVFSCIGSLTDSIFPKKLKDKMYFFSITIKDAMKYCGVEVAFKSEEEYGRNINFCKAYYNPNELYYGSEKVVAMTLRKVKYHFIIQGIIHIKSNFEFFKNIPGKYHAFFTKGVGKDEAFFFSLREEIIHRIISSCM